MNRYSRQITLPQIGLEGQEKLSKTRVFCVGAGGLGCSALAYLAAAGIGKIGIIDGDSVARNNLQRQILYNEKEIGKKKSTIACKYLRKLNSEIEIIDYPEFINSENIFNFIENFDYIIDATDNIKTKLLLNDAAHSLRKPLISSSVHQFHGQSSVFWYPQGPCMRCLYPDLDPNANLQNCEQSGVIGVIPGLFGILQAFEVIKLILQLPNNLIGKVWHWDALGGIPRVFDLKVSPDCPLCTEKETFDMLWPMNTHHDQITPKGLLQLIEQKADLFLLDVRTIHEHQNFDIGGTLIPLPELAIRLHEIPKTKTIIVYCHAGYRSQIALELLQKNGFNDVKNLMGGVLAWQQECAVI